MSDDELDRFAAEARADEAVRARGRERWLRRQAEEEGAFLGLLVDLAERGVDVVVCTAAGRRHRGPLVGVGRDFVAVAPASGGRVLVPVDGVEWVRAAPGEGVTPAGDRDLDTAHTFVDALEHLAADRARVVLVTKVGTDAVTGDVTAVGRDVVTVRVDGDPGGLVYVRLAALTEVNAPGS